MVRRLLSALPACSVDFYYLTNVCLAIPLTFVLMIVFVVGCTTYKLSYFENDPNSLTPTENYAPIRTYLPPDVPTECETTMQLSYQPVEPASVEKQFKRPSYQPPVHPMDDHTIYNTRFSPGYLIYSIYCDY